MGLFSRKKKNETYTTTLNGNTAKGRQEYLAELAQTHEDLFAWLEIKNNALSISVGNKKKTAGTIDSKITRALYAKYNKFNGLSCDITIGPNYTITKKDNILYCNVTITVVPE